MNVLFLKNHVLILCQESKLLHSKYFYSFSNEESLVIFNITVIELGYIHNYLPSKTIKRFVRFLYIILKEKDARSNLNFN